VAFWTYVVARNGGAGVLGPVAVSVITAVLAMPSSVLGNEVAIRFGRRAVIVTFMFVSGAVASAIAWLTTTAAPELMLGLVLLYAVTIPADSGALTSGMTASADPAYRGATMATHSTVGFGLSAAGGWAIGVALDAGGGPMSDTGWLVAFLVMAVSALVGPLAIWWSARGGGNPVKIE
jgi:hypothetical protein